jgi:hypothetical protein
LQTRNFKVNRFGLRVFGNLIKGRPKKLPELFESSFFYGLKLKALFLISGSGTKTYGKSETIPIKKHISYLQFLPSNF